MAEGHCCLGEWEKERTEDRRYNCQAAPKTHWGCSGCFVLFCSKYRSSDFYFQRRLSAKIESDALEYTEKEREKITTTVGKF